MSSVNVFDAFKRRFPMSRASEKSPRGLKGRIPLGFCSLSECRLNVAPVVHREARTRRHLLWKPPLLQGWWNNRRSANRAGRRVARTRKPSNGRLVKLELQKAGEAPDVPKEARTNPRSRPLNHRVERPWPKIFGSLKIGVFATRVTFWRKFTVSICRHFYVVV